jgi:hypothetical protein
LAIANLIAELKRRRVVRALIGYGVASFAVLQIVEPIMHGLHWPAADQVLEAGSNSQASAVKIVPGAKPRAHRDRLRWTATHSTRRHSRRCTKLFRRATARAFLRSEHKEDLACRRND